MDREPRPHMMPPSGTVSSSGTVPPPRDGPRLHVRLTTVALDPEAVRARVAARAAGATVVMVGSTRGMTDGVETVALEYEAHVPLAERVLEGILAAAVAAHDLLGAAVEHRLGRVPVGVASIVVATAAAHRRGAFAAAEWIVDQVKRSVPIWKCDEAPDGTRQWVHPGDLHGTADGRPDR
ncbi:MAG: molybdenum cofactor biosynthesis protein MoaE [Planctomycetia bacterium]|nr:molybdenum cofactor biosynthesis protein MoaE [Planctomycetia bacterium]